MTAVAPVAQSLRAFRSSTVSPSPESSANQVQEPKKSRDYADRDHFALARFLLCQSNALAFRACRALTDTRALPASPLFLHGHSGMGKTHLLTGVYEELRRKHGTKLKVYMTSAAGFEECFTSAIRQGGTRDFRSFFRTLDVFLLDDVHKLAGKPATQDELLFTLDALQAHGAQVVLGSLCPPCELGDMDERLATRFKAGLVACVQPLDGVSRLAMLRHLLGTGPVLRVGVVEYLSRHLNGSVAELLAVARRLAASAALNGRPLDLVMAQGELLEVLGTNRTITLDAIVGSVSGVFKVSECELMGRSRRRHLTRPRQVAMFLARELTPHSLQGVGRHFGGVSHTTVRLARRKVEMDMEADPELREVVERLLGALRDPRGHDPNS